MEAHPFAYRSIGHRIGLQAGRDLRRPPNDGPLKIGSYRLKEGGVVDGSSDSSEEPIELADFHLS